MFQTRLDTSIAWQFVGPFNARKEGEMRPMLGILATLIALVQVTAAGEPISAEYREDLAGPVSRLIARDLGKLVAFYDMGNSFGEDQSYDLLGLQHNYGFGMRWNSPFGPMRFEWGFPINRRPGDDKVVFNFTIGSFF